MSGEVIVATKTTGCIYACQDEPEEGLSTAVQRGWEAMPAFVS